MQETFSNFVKSESSALYRQTEEAVGVCTAYLYFIYKLPSLPRCTMRRKSISLKIKRFFVTLADKRWTDITGKQSKRAANFPSRSVIRFTNCSNYRQCSPQANQCNYFPTSTQNNFKKKSVLYELHLCLLMKLRLLQDNGLYCSGLSAHSYIKLCNLNSVMMESVLKYYSHFKCQISAVCWHLKIKIFGAALAREAGELKGILRLLTDFDSNVAASFILLSSSAG